jgi:hypothetical protein
LEQKVAFGDVIDDGWWPRTRTDKERPLPKGPQNRAFKGQKFSVAVAAAEAAVQRGELKGRRRQRTEKVGISLRQGLTLLSLSSIVVLLLLLLRESLWSYVLEDVKDYQRVTERGRILQCNFFFYFFSSSVWRQFTVPKSKTY